MVRIPAESEESRGDRRDNPGSGKPRAPIVLTGTISTTSIEWRKGFGAREGDRQQSGCRVHRKVSFNKKLSGPADGSEGNAR